jgi:hypothetical protein
MAEQLDRLQQLLKKVSYKPGYILNVQRLPETGDHLYQFQPNAIFQFSILHSEPDSNDPSTINMYSFGARLSNHQLEGMPDVRILQWIYHQLVQREVHEVKEWFKFDGINVYEPHPNKQEDAA